jgi:hypothetical protein
MHVNKKYFSEIENVNFLNDIATKVKFVIDNYYIASNAI